MNVQTFFITHLGDVAARAAYVAANATGMDISNPITVEGQSFSLARLNISPKSKLVNLSVNAVEQRYNVSVVFLRHDGAQKFRPTSGKQFAANNLSS